MNNDDDIFRTMNNDDDIFNIVTDTPTQGIHPWSPDDPFAINPTATPESVTNFMDRQSQGMSFDIDAAYNSTPETEVQVEIRYIYTDTALSDILAMVEGDVIKQQIKVDRRKQPNGNATITFGNQQDAINALNSRIWEDNGFEIKSSQLGQRRWKQDGTRYKITTSRRFRNSTKRTTTTERPSPSNTTPTTTWDKKRLHTCNSTYNTRTNGIERHKHTNY
jgi:hypothetical protein